MTENQGYPKKDSDQVNIQRVENGWVVYASAWARQREGYCPDGTFVAATPAELAKLLTAWAEDQAGT